jgi:homoserine dehydrogenase
MTWPVHVCLTFEGFVLYNSVSFLVIENEILQPENLAIVERSIALMPSYNLCILGFGNVGRALLRHLQLKTEELRQRYAITWRLTGVATRRMGWIADPTGLDATALLAGQLPPASPVNTVGAWLNLARADVLFELTSTDAWTGQPAIDHIRVALQHGAHVITANKGAVVYGYEELQALAQTHGKRFLFEATVMGGAPVFSLFQAALPATNLHRFRGLPNSTCNVIIEQMEQGKSFAEALQAAQALGIVETDPALDADGWDATLKVCAIAKVLMGVPLKPADVQRQGIRDLQPATLCAARDAGRPFKLVASVERTAAGVLARVQPEQIAPGDPLFGMKSGSMLGHFVTDMLPGLTVALHVPDDPTAGPDATAYDVLADFLRAVR